MYIEGFDKEGLPYCGSTMLFGRLKHVDPEEIEFEDATITFV